MSRSCLSVATTVLKTLGAVVMGAWLLSLCLYPVYPVHAQHLKQAWPQHVTTPPLEVMDRDGARWAAAALKGKTVLLNFWGTWCGPCLEELPSLQALQQKTGKSDVIVLTINVGDSPNKLDAYMSQHGLSLPVVMDPHREMAKRWGIRIYPSTVILSPKGQARWKLEGALDWEEPQVYEWLSQVR